MGKAQNEESAAGISAIKPDWTREQKRLLEWSPSRSLLASIRSFQRAESCGSGWRRFLLRKLALARHRFWSIVTGADIPVTSNIAGGLLLPHPNGVVIHPDAKIGPNCLIFQQVTIGTRESAGAPQLGGHVDIGAGARILGSIRIGEHARIGANAVVLRDVPPGKTAVGIPATIVDEATNVGNSVVP